MNMYIFVVSPSGEWYSTSRVGDPCEGDPRQAYLRAHLCAAGVAARKQQVAFVTRHDTGHARYGFADDALDEPTSILRQVLERVHGAYFDFHERAWRPLPPVPNGGDSGAARRIAAPRELVEEVV